MEENMKTRLIMLCVLLAMFMIMYASEDPAEQEEYTRKSRELKNLSERFKSETGFGGTIEYNYETMRLQSFRGTFPGIPFPVTSDSTALRNSFEQVIEKMAPYLSASKIQLEKTPIHFNRWGDGTRYIQKVNGYTIEGGGYLNITYSIDQKRIDVLDETVYIPQQPVGKMISEEEAEIIVMRDMNDNRYKMARIMSVFYSNRGSDSYYLAYHISVSDSFNPIFGDYIYYIDAFNGKVMMKQRVTFINYDTSVRTLGKDYIESSSWNYPPAYFSEEPMNDVRVIVAPDTSQTNQSGYAYFSNAVDSLKTVKLENDRFKVTCGADSLNAESYSIAEIDSTHQYVYCIPDDSYFAPNVYIEAINHIHNLKRNEPVLVKVSNCPQNTRINVYIVKHGEYTIADGDTVASLAAHYASGFTPVVTATTDPSGEWTSPTPIWTTPGVADNAVGDYDIIVDIGSPTTPDGRIHYAFSGANVMDGFDGRINAGFTIVDKGIDVVMAQGISAFYPLLPQRQ